MDISDAARPILYPLAEQETTAVCSHYGTATTGTDVRHFIRSEHDVTKKKNIAERAAVAFDTKTNISILGRTFPITVLSESTPFLYQWFHKNEESVYARRIFFKFS